MATLIDVATPGPALAAAQSTTNNTSAVYNSVLLLPTAVNLTTASTYYQLNSISIPNAGTWAICGAVFGTAGGYNYTPVISRTTANGVAAGPMQTSGSNITFPYITSYGCVVKLTGATTLYLNASASGSGSVAQGLVYAVQIA